MLAPLRFDRAPRETVTRIIGGTAGGRRLSTPRGAATRPTSDRVREALFSAVESWCGSLHGLRFLDLYAGSGAVGLEAWSRGAGVVTLVEQDRRTAALITSNAKTLGFPKANVVVGPVAATLARPPVAPYDVVFLDPPYPTTGDEVDGNLEQLSGEWVVPGGMVVVERSSRSRAPQWPSWFAETRERKYGETTLWYGHAAHPR
jgi:16S rRNA (guanine966-N2)-methyltransferase